MLARYGGRITKDQSAPAAFKMTSAGGRDRQRQGAPGNSASQLGLTTALTIAALAWGLVNFGVLLWLPASLISEGHSVGLTSAIIARSALISIPTIAIATYLYSFWSSKGVLILSIGITTLGLIATLLRNQSSWVFLSNPLVSVTLMIVGSSGVISILMPYAAESFPIKQRGRATGWVAGWSKVGGVLAQGMAVGALVPAFGLAAGAIAIPTAASLLLIATFGHETRGRDLRDLEAAVPLHANS